MTDLLRKIFIKDYKNVSNARVRRKHGFLASIVGAFTNLILFVFKILIGIFTFSISIITDAVNNLSDMASSIINLIGFKLAGKPADKKHPFGHERIEYIAGMIISFIIIGIAIVLNYLSIQKIIKNEGVEITYWTFIILGAAILIKLWQSFFYKKIAKEINSVSLKASSQDSLNDVISTIAVLLTTIVEFTCMKLKVTIPFSLDGVVGVLLSLFIIFIGVKLIIETANPLIGLTPDNELVKNVIKDITSYKGVLGTHDLMCHSYGPTKVFMTLHVEVDSRVDVMKSHDLIDNIESDIYRKYNVLLTIHMDPIDNFSPLVKSLRNKISLIIKKYNVKLTYHDFRIVQGETHTNILFDVVVPYELGIKHDKLKLYLIKEIKKIDPKYNLVVKIDSEYTN